MKLNIDSVLLKKDMAVISDASYHSFRSSLGTSLSSLFPTLNSVKDQRSRWNTLVNQYVDMKEVHNHPGYEVNVCFMFTFNIGLCEGWVDKST